jgi:hypothetical protein
MKKMTSLLSAVPVVLFSFFTVLLLLPSRAVSAEPETNPPGNPDPKFYLYLAFGQSNMAGGGSMKPGEDVVDSRFQVLADFDNESLNRKMGQWYDAKPPLMRGTRGVTICDYFGRTMVANLPQDVRVGVVKCAVSGTKIELWDNDAYKQYLDSLPAADSWKITAANVYEGNPYKYLVKLAKIAQRSGVIKGFLVHQGESNFQDQEWPNKLKKIYDDLCRDLNLDPKETHLFAGEVVDAEHHGQKAEFNEILKKLPNTLHNAHVISAKDLPCNSDNLHFTADGQREFGRRYAVAALEVLGITAREPKDPYVKSLGPTTAPPSPP